MNTLPDILKVCVLFKNMSSEDLLTCLNNCNYIIKRYSKGNLVHLEGQKCEEMGILLKGLLKVQTIYPSGKALTLTQLKPAEIFGEVIILSKTNQCPATVNTIEDSEQRPSLSRELCKMREEEIIEFDREVIIIKDMSVLDEL